MLLRHVQDQALQAPGRAGVGLEELRAAVGDCIGRHGDGRIRRFKGPEGGHRYETISGRRRRLGVPL